MSKQIEVSLDRASHNVSTRQHQLNTEEESTIVSGVAQIANIGSIISSTFAVFNDRFARFDSILVENTRFSDEITGDSRAQRQKISHVIKSMNAMQDQINAIAASVHRIEIQIGASKESDRAKDAVEVTVTEKDEDILREREITLEKELLAEEKSEDLKQERDKVRSRITDLEKEMHGVKLNPTELDIDSSVTSSAPNDTFVVSAALTEQKEELLRIVSILDEEIDENEKAPKVFRQLLPAQDIHLRLDEEFLPNSEDKHQVSERGDSILRNLSKLDLFEKYELSADSQEVSSERDSIQPTQSTHKSAGTAIEPLLPINDDVIASIAANNEAIEVMMGIVNQLREEAVLDRKLAAKNKEALSQCVAEIKCAAELNSGNFMAKLRDVNERLIDYQEGSQSGPGSTLAVKRLQVALNDVIAEVDDLKYKGPAQNGDSSLVDQHMGGQQQGSQDHVNTANLLLQIEITSVKNKLLGLRDDLDSGLDSYADAHATDPEGSEAFESPFIARVAEFADRLDNVILTFYSKETPEATLIALFHPLDALTIELEALFELDQQSVISMGITFDDVTAEDNGRSVRDTMRLVWEASLPLLDHRVNKITMRRRLTALEAAVRSKADATVVSSLEAELRYMIAAKADQKELLSIMSKKVSIGELQRLKDQLMKQIVSIRGFEYSQVGTLNLPAGSREEGIIEGGLTSAQGLEMSSELKQLGRRFDILHSFHEDLVTQCTGYVPREEVEQALRALLGEMKIMKGNSITADLLGESLKTKANTSEVQK